MTVELSLNNIDNHAAPYEIDTFHAARVRLENLFITNGAQAPLGETIYQFDANGSPFYKMVFYYDIEKDMPEPVSLSEKMIHALHHDRVRHAAVISDQSREVKIMEALAHEFNLENLGVKLDEYGMEVMIPGGDGTTILEVASILEERSKKGTWLSSYDTPDLGAGQKFTL